MSSLPAIALYQPDIPQNLGAIIRLCACSGFALHIIEPCGFPLDDARIKRVGMDYVANVQLSKHASWEEFCRYATGEAKQLLLFTTKSNTPYTAHAFSAQDILLFGRESAGVPEEVHQRVEHRLTIPMPGGGRSLNLAMSAAMVTGEALRQLV